MSGRFVRRFVAVVAGVVALLLPGGTVFADPAGPTDYRSEIIAIDPPTPGIDVEILGGDSFLQLTVESGVEAEVLGYRGEPYLTIRPDGTVWENRLSPTTYLNEERFGTEFPDFADPDADPEWRQVGSEGRWSWHDHRAHLMQPSPPFGTTPGDRILESVVPLIVDGDEVDVTVISIWEPEPSGIPLLLGGAFGGLIGAAAIAFYLRGGAAPAGMLAAASVALLVGGWQFISLPAETGPRITWWMLPVMSMLAAGGAMIPVVRRDRLISGALLSVAGATAVAWAWMRRDGLTAAIVPTDAPNWLDRGTTVMLLVVGVVMIVLGAVAALRPENSGSLGTDRTIAAT